MRKTFEDKKYQTIITENKDNLQLWARRINDYRNYSVSKSPANDEWGKFIYEIAGYLRGFLKVFIEFGKFKDKFIEPTFELYGEGIESNITSEKMAIKFNFGFDYKGLYLNTCISNPECLKNVHDDFWETFLKLSQFGDFKFDENAGFGNDVKKRYAHLFKPTKSNLYRLQRNYFLQEFLRKEDRDNIEISDLGWFYMRWSPKEYGAADILVMGCEAFKLMYQLNYLLWKASKAA